MMMMMMMMMVIVIHGGIYIYIEIIYNSCLVAFTIIVNSILLFIMCCYVSLFFCRIFEFVMMLMLMMMVVLMVNLNWQILGPSRSRAPSSSSGY